jgi:hypothetical protein
LGKQRLFRKAQTALPRLYFSGQIAQQGVDAPIDDTGDLLISANSTSYVP